MSTITQQDIFLAQKSIRSIAKQTPLVQSPLLTEKTGIQVRLKLETVQEIGAFKIRGAANKILHLPPEIQARGVVTASTGNHGRAVAYVANELNIPATVCISELVPQNKVDALKRLGAEVVIVGQSQDEAEERANQLQNERGLTMIHPFDDPHIIAGQGTIGLELLTEWPEVDTVLVPLSGGGLIAGIALALKSANPVIWVIGVSMERGAVMYHSLRAGRPLQLHEEPTLADSLQGGIGLDNQHTFHMVQNHVDETILVSEEEIEAAMTFALREHHLVVEGAGAVGIAALQNDKVKNRGNNIAVVISGGNVDMKQLLQIVP
ncbi:MAG: hydroxyectoine utilization dehydratase EutB [Anaerolineae bacterium]